MEETTNTEVAGATTPEVVADVSQETTPEVVENQEEHVITAADLELNPELKEAGVEEGDVIGVPVDEATPEEAAEIDATPEEVATPATKIHAGKKVISFDGKTAVMETGETIPMTEEDYEDLPTA